MLHMRKGFRQSDPITPMLSLIVDDTLGSLMRKAVSLGMFKGVMVRDESLQISLLRFVDDALLLGEPSIKILVVLKVILIIFEVISGLRVNFHKIN